MVEAARVMSYGRLRWPSRWSPWPPALRQRRRRSIPVLRGRSCSTSGAPRVVSRAVRHLSRILKPLRRYRRGVSAAARACMCTRSSIGPARLACRRRRAVCARDYRRRDINPDLGSIPAVPQLRDFGWLELRERRRRRHRSGCGAVGHDRSPCARSTGAAGRAGFSVRHLGGRVRRPHTSSVGR